MTSRAGRVFAVVLSGALHGLPFVEPALGPVAFVAWVPGLVALGALRDPLSRRALALAITACVFIAGFLVALPVLRVSLVGQLIQSTFTEAWVVAALIAFVYLRRRTGWPMALLWPACWVAAEWGWSYHSVGRLAFGLTGYTLAPYPRLIQIADFCGVLGVSFVLQLTAGAIADVALAWLERGTSGLSAKRTRVIAAACAGTLVAVTLYGTFRLAGARTDFGPRLALVQPALPHDILPQHTRSVQVQQVAFTRARVRPGEADMVVFPENAVLTYIEDSDNLEDFKSLSRDLGAPILAGVNTHTAEDLARMRRGEKQEEMRVLGHRYRHGTNTAAIIDERGLGDRYQKVHLLPFTEQVPGEALFRSLGRLQPYREFIVSTLGYMGTAVAGDQVNLLSIPGSPPAAVWTPICFELADARLARQASLTGARAFVNITSEGDLGPQIYWNTMAMATLRAVELHVGVARAGNMGITTTIDPWGRPLEVLRGPSGSLWGEPGVLIARLPLGPDARTIYARTGDWIAGVCAALLGAGAITAWRRRRRA